MLGPEKKAVVVRKPDGGLEEQVEERVLIKDKHPALGLPLLRGVFNFCSSLANGVKALMYSASFSRRTRRSRRSPPGSSSGWTDTWAARRPPPFLSPWRWCWASFSPWGCSSCCPPPSPDWVGLAVPLPMWLRNLLEGVVRIVIFMGYLMLCSHMKDIHRVFQYHGAEHKTIFCYEHGLP